VDIDDILAFFLHTIILEDHFDLLAPITHIHPFATIRRERLLPVPGSVLVRKGQKINATDIIAEVDLSPEYLMLDVARGLALPGKKADQYLQCKVGDNIVEGDVVAGPVGIMKRVVRSPRSGRVVLASDGQVFLKLVSSPFQLRAGLPGVVYELVGDRGAVIETTGALIQGVWGNSRVDSGLLHILAKEPDDVLQIDRLDVSLRGSVILSGHCAQREVLSAAEELPLRGLILASLDPTLIPHALKTGFPIIVIEGFGHFGMNSTAFKLLTTNEKREVALNAEPWDRFTGRRPEIVIPLPAAGELPVLRDISVFALDQTVRVLRAPCPGKIGKIVDLPSEPVPLPYGLFAQSGEIRLENGNTVVLPLANLEIVE
jgi:hypothetical protein